MGLLALLAYVIAHTKENTILDTGGFVAGTGARDPASWKSGYAPGRMGGPYMNRLWMLGLAVLATVSSVTACVTDVSTIGVGSGDGGNGGGSDGGNSDGGPIGTDAGDGSTGDGAVATVPPTHAAGAVVFVDVDPRTGTVGGLIRITKAADESDVDGYAIYVADDKGKKKSTTPLGTVTPTGKNVVYRLPDGTTLQDGVTELLVLTQNAAGEMATGPTTPYHDAVVYAKALTPASTVGTITSAPSVAIDTTNHKLLAVVGDVLFHCELDGTGCTSANIGGGRKFVGPSAPLFVPSTSKVVVVASGYPEFNAIAVTSTVDGTATPLVDVTPKTPASSGVQDTALIDSTRARLIVAVNHGANDISPSGRSVLYDCAYDGTSCTRRDIYSGSLPDSQGANGGQSPSIALDATSGTYIVASMQASNSPFILVCPAASGGCVGHASITGAISAPNQPYALVDGVNKKLLVVSRDGTHSPYVTRCSLDATGCAIPAGMTAGTTAGEKANSGLSAVIDPANQKIVAAAIVAGYPALFRCNLDATGCAYGDMTQSSGAWGVTSLVTDPESGQPYLVVTTNSGSVPWLFTMK